MLRFELHAPGTDIEPAQTYTALLRRDVDGLYWDADQAQFSAFGDIAVPEIPLVEDSAISGRWFIEIDIGNDAIGSYTFFPRDGLEDVRLADKVQTLYVTDGAPAVDAERAKTLLHEHYGGYRALGLVSEDGTPIVGACVRVYTKDDYVQRKLTPVGVTMTGRGGAWVSPVPVARGDTYVVHFHKAGFAATHTEIVVP